MNNLERKIYDLLVEIVSTSRIRGLRRCGEIAVQVASLCQEEAEKKRPNRVVVEVRDSAVVMIRATRPNDVVVTVLDFDVALDHTEDGIPIPADVWGQDGIPISKLNTVAAPIVSNSIKEGVGHVMEWLAECEEEARPLQHPKLQA